MNAAAADAGAVTPQRRAALDRAPAPPAGVSADTAGGAAAQTKKKKKKKVSYKKLAVSDTTALLTVLRRHFRVDGARWPGHAEWVALAAEHPFVNNPAFHKPEEKEGDYAKRISEQAAKASKRRRGYKKAAATWWRR